MEPMNPPADASAFAATTMNPERLVRLQHAYLLEQIACGESKSNGGLNRHLTSAARQQLQLSPETANEIRRQLVDQGYLEEKKQARAIFYSLTDAGQEYLDQLERPQLPQRANRMPIDEAPIPDDLREAQKCYLLLQLLNANGQPVTRAEANKLQERLRISLGLKPAVANHRRAQLAEQGYIRTATVGRTVQYSLTSDGLDYLAATAKHLDHVAYTLSGKALNALIMASRDAFRQDQTQQPTPSQSQVPGSEELANVILAEFQELLREGYARSGLVPIHEVRQRIVERFGPAAGRHDVFDEVVLSMWREHRLGLEAISDLHNVNQQQLNDSIQGVNRTLFYLEAPREQAIAP